MTCHFADDEQLPIKRRLIEPLFVPMTTISIAGSHDRADGPMLAASALVGTAPADQCLTLLGDDLVDRLLAGLPLLRIRRQKDDARPISPTRRQRRLEFRLRDLLQKLERQGRENARSVTRVLFATTSPTVSHPLEHLIRIIDDLPRSLPLDVRDEANAAGIVLVGGIVKTLFLRPAVAVKLYLSHQITFWQTLRLWSATT